ncbi:MAG: class I SAM-dependent methyltransferase [Bryobacteraceae bacterium]
MERNKRPALDWSAVADHLRLSKDGQPLLSVSEPCPGDPDVENQIGAPSPQSISSFRQFHLPMIRAAAIDPGSCRILEIGAGFGQLAYGTLKTIGAELYVATDVFPHLVSVLNANLPQWTDSPAGAAILDPQDPLLFKPGLFNVIQSHSVLHHVLDYRGAVRALYDRLATPGVMIFCEPCLDGYLFFLATVRQFRKLVPLPEATAEKVRLVEEYIVDRTGPRRSDPGFLRRFGAGDKYLYSLYDLMELADSIGARLFIQKDGRSMKENLKFELRLRGGDDDLLAQFDVFLSELLPEGVENAYFSDLRQVFSLRKS